jgi:hypothetical protein
MRKCRQRGPTPASFFVASAVFLSGAAGCVANAGDETSASAEEAAKSAGASGDFGGNDGVWNLTGSWQLQLPTGSADNPTILNSLAGVKNDYFFIGSDGALTFMDPTKGWTTKGSQHPRSELRELGAGWKATGTNTLTATVEVVDVPATVTIAQIFQAPSAPSKPLLELQYHKGGKVVAFMEPTNAGTTSGESPKFADVGTTQQGSKFQYQVGLSNDEITVKIGTQVSNFALPPTFRGESFYFKWGAYDQTATAGAPGTTPGTLVKFYDVQVVHK